MQAVAQEAVWSLFAIIPVSAGQRETSDHIEHETGAVTPVYHVTHLRNLQSIVRLGGPWSDADRDSRGLAPVNIAHTHIKRRRAIRSVDRPPGGTLDQYVPFYFAPRSPMLYSIGRGNVEGYNEGQRPIVHLVTSVERIQRQQLPFLFTDGHAAELVSEFFDDLARLDQIDWQIMRERYWADTQEDGDRSRRRQAEFLVHHFIPWVLVEAIGVMDPRTTLEVEALLARSGHIPPVTVRRDWYYEGFR